MARLINLAPFFVLRLECFGFVRLAALSFSFIVGIATPGQSLAAQSVSDVPNFTIASDRISVDASREIIDRDAVTSASSDLWRSTDHRSNILQPRFARVGIAAMRVSDGEIFVEDFSDFEPSAPATMTGAAIESKTDEGSR